MKLKIRVADPAGNITIFVMTPTDRKDYVRIANELLEHEEFHAEQVGYVEEQEDGTLHMQMMGGEFCGNATRSFGYLQSLLSEDHPEIVLADVSGSTEKLVVEADLHARTSRTTMPLPQKIMPVEIPGYGEFPLVCFEGICHMIVEHMDIDAELVETALKQLKMIEKCDAYGIMFLKKERLEQEYHMTPVVYVGETDSLVWESSCGSGSMACASYLASKEENGEFAYDLRQPGGLIQAVVKRENQTTVQCKMGGPVSISEELEVEIL